MFLCDFALGMSGTFEGTARGTPMLFIPFFADQQRNNFTHFILPFYLIIKTIDGIPLNILGNALKSVSSGNALMLAFPDLTAESFSANLNEILGNKAYYNRAKEIARLFNDNLVHPMDEAIFWIEYVMRSKGAMHLKSHAAYMNWFSYLLLDIFIVPIAAIMLVYVAIRWLLRAKKPTENKGDKKHKAKKMN